MIPETGAIPLRPPETLRALHAGTVVRSMKSTRVRYQKKPPVFTGPRERFGQMLVRMRQLEGNPHCIALGMAVGIFVSITPIIPLQTIVAVALAFVLRGSKSAAALGTWLSNPAHHTPGLFCQLQAGLHAAGGSETVGQHRL